MENSMNLPDKIWVYSENNMFSREHGTFVFEWDKSSLCWRANIGIITTDYFYGSNIDKLKIIFYSKRIYSLSPITEDIINLWKIR